MQHAIDAFSTDSPAKRSEFIHLWLLRENFSLLAALFTEFPHVPCTEFSPTNRLEDLHIHFALTSAAEKLRKGNYWRADGFMRIARCMVERGGSIDEHPVADSTGLWDLT